MNWIKISYWFTFNSIKKKRKISSIIFTDLTPHIFFLMQKSCVSCALLNYLAPKNRIYLIKGTNLGFESDLKQVLLQRWNLAGHDCITSIITFTSPYCNGTSNRPIKQSHISIFYFYFWTWGLQFQSWRWAYSNIQH